jgi:hypothetical protein
MKALPLCREVVVFAVCLAALAGAAAMVARAKPHARMIQNCVCVETK